MVRCCCRTNRKKTRCVTLLRSLDRLLENMDPLSVECPARALGKECRLRSRRSHPAPKPSLQTTHHMLPVKIQSSMLGRVNPVLEKLVHAHSGGDLSGHLIHVRDLILEKRVEGAGPERRLPIQTGRRGGYNQHGVCLPVSSPIPVSEFNSKEVMK